MIPSASYTDGRKARLKQDNLTAAVALLGFFTAQSANDPNLIVSGGEGSGSAGTSVQLDYSNPPLINAAIHTPNLIRLAGSGMSFSDSCPPSPRCTTACVALLTIDALSAHGFRDSTAPTLVKSSHFNAGQGFDCQQPIIFQDDFRSGLGKWKLAMDAGEDRASLDNQTQEKLLRIVQAPDTEQGRMAVRCLVPRALGSFRAEIALPHEEGFHERWYGARIYVPADWIFSPDDGGDIVLQWHAILGKELKKLKSRNFPPLSIAIKNDRWVVNRSCGTMDSIHHDVTPLDGTVGKGRWVSWVIHVRWSSGADGSVQIWKDGELVFAVKGPNTYSIKPTTPYFKTGLYHPQWKRKNEGKFKKAETVVAERVIYTADVKIGDERARYEDVAPAPSGPNK